MNSIRNLLLILSVVSILFFLASGCSKQSNILCGNENEEYLYYYYQDEKFYVKQIKDKLFLNFAQNVTNKQALDIFGSFSSLRLTSDIPMHNMWDQSPQKYIVIENKNGKAISSEILESFKKSDDIISVSYLYLEVEGGKLHGLLDRFVVKLKETTTYTQLEELAEQNNCIMIEKIGFVLIRHVVYIPKTHQLNAIQISSLFYETELFEYTSPSFIVINGLDF